MYLRNELVEYDEYIVLHTVKLINPEQNINIFFKGFNSGGEKFSKQLHKNDINVKRHK